jgi:hypothetical protein
MLYFLFPGAEKETHLRIGFIDFDEQQILKIRFLF